MMMVRIILFKKKTKNRERVIGWLQCLGFLSGA